jgi:hypothetical protein
MRIEEACTAVCDDRRSRELGNLEAASLEDIVVFEVMVESLDAQWWKTYRKTLERAFRQKSIIVRAQDIQLLWGVSAKSGSSPSARMAL